MASYEKIVKYLVEKVQQALSPLEVIVRNQEIIIQQNKKMQELLENLHSSRLLSTNEETNPSANLDQTAEESDFTIDFDNISNVDEPKSS